MAVRTVPPLVLLVGPTAAGKSSLAVEIASSFGGEIVSADAMQVYRGLDIGTAKATMDERDRVPHHCIDLVGPEHRFSAGEYARAANAAIKGIRARRRPAFVVGGSGFYVRALVDGLAPLPDQDSTWRKTLEEIEERRGLQHLYRMLSGLDPAWAAKVGGSDRQRILRGLEVTLRVGEPMSDVLAREGWSVPPERKQEAVWVGLTWSRELLRERIARRVDEMIAAGWVDEVRRLLAEGVPRDAPALRAIGYRELAEHVEGDLSLAVARDRIVTATRQYSKRQLTWFRKQTPARWFTRREDNDADREAVEARVHSFVSAGLA